MGGSAPVRGRGRRLFVRAAGASWGYFYLDESFSAFAGSISIRISKIYLELSSNNLMILS